MYYAPVIIPTLCRYEHFKECMESLASNTWAAYTEVYIGLDYPAKETHREGYEKICDYLEKKKFSFSKVNIFKRESNYGVAKNVEDLRDVVRKKYDRFIVTEDDNIFSENFLEYMDTMLEKTKDLNDVFGVCGYSYPIEYLDVNGDNCSFYVNSVFPAWGYGTFFDKRDRLLSEYTHEFLINSVKDNRKVKKLRSFGRLFFSWYINRACDEKVTYSDIDMQLYQTLSGKVSVMPAKSLVRNMGWDGSGINCQTGSYDFSSQELYVGDITDTILPTSDERESQIREFIGGLNKITWMTSLKCNIKCYLVKLGIRR